MIISIPGYPEQIGEHIEFPEAIDLLHQPMWHFATAEHVYKYGSNFQKHLLDKAPLTHKTKYVFFSCQVRVIYPGFLVNKIELPHLGSNRNEWHIDVSTNETAKVHAITNALGTEFNTTPFDLEIGDKPSYLSLIESVANSGVKLTPKGTPTNRFVTFDRHIHRAPLPNPTKREVRFFVRINEMDMEMPGSGRIDTSVLYDGSTPIPNVTQKRDGSIILHPMVKR